jgi:catechol 2,3-dioxygenase-like lactoylglutathione lyase family enzyme
MGISSLPSRRISMLSFTRIIAFVPTKDTRQARAFYEGVLGLRFVSEDQFALVLDAKGIMVRVAVVQEFQPQPFTIVGWEVADIKKEVAGLQAKGIRFEKYGMEGQDEQGIWASPSGARVAWFKDPDGNVLSLTQFS